MSPGHTVLLFNPLPCECAKQRLDLASFALQCRKIANSPNIKGMTASEVLKHVLISGIAMPERAVSFARILAIKPHSADVERLIRSYNLVKTTDRLQLSAKTLKCYLFIRHNMPVVT